MGKFLLQSPIFYDTYSTGSLMSKSTTDVSALGDFAGFGMMALMDATLYPLFIIVTMAVTISLPMTLITVIPMMLLILVSHFLEGYFDKTYKKKQESFDHINEKVLENVSSVRVVRSFVTEEREKKTFSTLARTFLKDQLNFDKILAAYIMVSQLIPGICFVLCLISGAYFLKRGSITLGELISMTLYLELLVWPMFAFSEYIATSQQASASMDRLQELLSYKEEKTSNPEGKTFDPSEDISFKDYDFTYPGAESTSLKGIHLTLKPGETLGVVGKIGSGKTTLLKQFLHLYPIKDNCLFYGETPAEGMNVTSIRENLGYVPQDHLLFSKSVRENVLFYDKNLEPQLEEALIQADFLKDLDQLPEGLETLTGEKGISLSGGQKQRLSMARALIRDPFLLILDDSLSAVDATTEAKIIETIKRTRKGKTTIIAAHRLSAVLHADKIIVLEDGYIMDQGTHEELSSREGWYKEQYEHQRLEGGEDV